MKGYKGFNKGLICRGKRYAENETFQEEKAELCKSGMHFCENPFDVLIYYGFVDDNAELNEFCEVESEDERTVKDDCKCVTDRLHVGAKIGINGLVGAFVNFTIDRCTKEESKKGFRSAATATGDYSASSATGDQSASTATGDYSASTATGDQSAAIVEGHESVAIALGICGKVKGKIGCFLVCSEWEQRKDGWHRITVLSTVVDGAEIEEDVFYTVREGKFTRCEDED